MGVLGSAEHGRLKGATLGDPPRRIPQEGIGSGRRGGVGKALEFNSTTTTKTDRICRK